MTLDETGSPLEIGTGNWTWANDEQTQFYVDDDWTGNISELSITNWNFMRYTTSQILELIGLLVRFLKIKNI